MESKKRFCWDLDGTLCETRVEGQEYCDVQPIEETCIILRHLYREGHYIIIQTARNMVTHDGNVGKIIKHQLPVIQEWLARHNLPYHELHVGKPHADYFIDDKAVNPTTMTVQELHSLLIGSTDIPIT